MSRQRSRKSRRLTAVLVLLAAPTCAAGQDAATETAKEPPSEVVDADDGATELEAIRVTAPRLGTEVIDPYRFRNPVQVQGTRFGRDWHETPSLEEIGKQGGIVPLAVNYLAGKVNQGMKHVPGWKQQIQSAVARPPPLDEAQMRRAASICEEPQQAGCGERNRDQYDQ
ncbi:hypothetical protein CSC70_04505 [Pseudoxanthomonas kalamensis DSM 18571]|uniref:hypothetical protein n=1 Tax=Pseudoxanthomonas kalamensis TaxID=289483 RepID=UPI0013915EA0|nr:hypothetical protein [Pseudoxanthomonas kalamensis]KAF1711185.1 hypothetical protein CSC70_04505 [Pseudoxanthomonas kalamensis DSM 18571]